jgi:hypothetical protein
MPETAAELLHGMLTCTTYFSAVYVMQSTFQYYVHVIVSY